MRYLRSLLVLFGALGLAAPSAWAEDAPPAAAAPTAPPAPPAAEVTACCGSCQPSTCCPPRDPCRRSRLEIQAGVSLLRPDPEGLVSQPNPAVTDEGRWDALDYGIAPSGRIAWTFAAGAWDVTAAGTFWGLWDEDENLTNARLTNGTGGNTVFPVVALHSEALLWDINLTATKPFHCSPCFTAAWGGGIRYLRFDEESSFGFTGNPPTDSLAADIDNGLLAAEAVVQAVWKLSSRWDLFARLSAFGGWMHTSGEATASGPTVPGFGTAHENTEDRFGYGGEVEVALRWHVSACWTLSLGYDFLALGEVARSYKGVDSSFTPAPVDLGPILSEDWLTVHRVYLGIAFDL